MARLSLAALLGMPVLVLTLLPAGGIPTARAFVPPGPDLELDINGDNHTGGIDQLIDQVIILYVPGTATDVTVSTSTPPNTTFYFEEAFVGSWTTVAPAMGGTGPITFSAASIDSNVYVFRILLRVAPTTPPATKITLTANVTTTSADPDLSNNTASWSRVVMPAAELTIDQTASSATAPPGSLVTYTITATNFGPSNASPVWLADTLPAGTKFVSATTSGGGWVVAAKPSPGGTGTVSFVNGSLAPGITTLTIVVRVDARVTVGSVITNTATIAARVGAGANGLPTFDQFTSNNSANATVTVSYSPQPPAPVSKTSVATTANSAARSQGARKSAVLWRTVSVT